MEWKYMLYSLLCFICFFLLQAIYRDFVSEESSTYLTKYKPKYRIGCMGGIFILILFVVLLVFGGILWW